ncbi:MAG: histidine phosphatase family protein [Bifidobacterium sp.]|nr:histidine phosphatase family protein [Bifidobacterium sp.]
MANQLKQLAKRAKGYKYVLLVMRHAKTEPFDAHGDFERTLTDKGLKQAKKVAKALESVGLVPDQIDCSSAVRARQTCGRMLKVFGDGPKVEYVKALYDDGMQAVFDALASCKDKRRTLMVIGHEPTVSMACQWLASARSERSLLDLLNLGMSTASVAVFGSDAPLRKWGTHDAELLGVLNPRDL